MATLRETRVSDRIRVYTPGGDTLAESFGANCTAILGDSAVALIDPLVAPALAREVEAAVARETAVPVRFVLLSHHHTDHALGAGHFARRGVPVIAHHACRQRMAVEHPALVAERRESPPVAELFADAEPYLPPVTFERSLRLDLGGVRVNAVHRGRQHTAGDAFFHVPEENLVVTGDLVSVGYHVNYEHARPEALAGGLAAIEALAAAIVIPGHGPVSGPAAIAEQAGYHREVAEFVRRRSEDGESRAGIVAALARRFPGYRLAIALESAAARFSGRRTSGRAPRR